mmetsp:Transcript_40851/g.107237  ORF Transcript_40851/g.107237 Transcript_40851/m.107237 type:complete len:214 (+) Transcript_40851:340-981(+)
MVGTKSLSGSTQVLLRPNSHLRSTRRPSKPASQSDPVYAGFTETDVRKTTARPRWNATVCVLVGENTWKPLRASFRGDWPSINTTARDPSGTSSWPNVPKEAGSYLYPNTSSRGCTPKTSQRSRSSRPTRITTSACKPSARLVFSRYPLSTLVNHIDLSAASCSRASSVDPLSQSSITANCCSANWASIVGQLSASVTTDPFTMKSPRWRSRL